MTRTKKVFFYVLAEIMIVAVVVAVGAPPANAETVISFNWGKGIKGSGKIVTVQRPVAAFDRVEVQDGIHVDFSQSTEPKLTVTADDNIEPMVETRVDGSTLKLKMRSRSSFRTSTPVRVNLDYLQLDALSLADGARGSLGVVKAASFTATVKDGAQLRVTEINASRFELQVNDGSSASIGSVIGTASQRYRVSDGATVTVDRAAGDRVSVVVNDGAQMTLRALDSKALDVSVADGARADVAGKAQQQSYTLSDAARVDTQKLEGAAAQVRATDGSVLNLGLVQTLNVDAQDGSAVRYSGDPTIAKRLRDGATLKRM